MLTPFEALTELNKLNDDFEYLVQSQEGKWLAVKEEPELKYTPLLEKDYWSGINYADALTITTPIDFAGRWQDSLHSIHELECDLLEQYTGIKPNE